MRTTPFIWSRSYLKPRALLDEFGASPGAVTCVAAGHPGGITSPALPDAIDEARFEAMTTGEISRRRRCAPMPSPELRRTVANVAGLLVLQTRNEALDAAMHFPRFGQRRVELIFVAERGVCESGR